MEPRIDIKPAAGGAIQAASGALEIFRAEIRGISPYVTGISVNLEEAPDAPFPEPAKSVRVRVDFLGGGTYLSETRGRDWQGLVPSAASRAAHGARAVLRQRWELQEE